MQVVAEKADLANFHYSKFNVGESISYPHVIREFTILIYTNYSLDIYPIILYFIFCCSFYRAGKCQPEFLKIIQRGLKGLV